MRIERFPLPASLDHLVYSAPELQTGMDEIDRLLGVRPVVGGRHPGYGTHNALLSLGSTSYLEIVAPDPEEEPPERGMVFGLDGLETSRLSTWVLRTEAIEELASQAGAAGVDLGAILSGERETPDGTVLSWKVSDPYAARLGGAVPFLISWGETPHPAGANPPAGELVGIRIEHPEPDRIREALVSLGVDIQVGFGDTIGLTATIRTSGGEVELR